MLCTNGSSPFGIFIFGSPASTLSDNSFVGCDVGIATFGDINVSSTVAVGNRVGIGLDGSSTIDRSLAAGNHQVGISVISGSTSIAIRESSVLGNGEGDANCGIDAGSTAATVADIWYGAATGPGANPADGLCSSVSVPSPTFADKAIKVKLKPIR